MRILRLTTLVCLVLVPTMVELRAAENSKNFEEFKSRVEKEFAPKLATVIAKLGAGKIKSALDDLENQLGFLHVKTKGPFGIDTRKALQTNWERLSPNLPNYDVIEFVGIQKYSSQSCQLYCFAHGCLGPHIFRISVNEYRGELCMGAMKYTWSATDNETPQLAKITHSFLKRFRVSADSLKVVAIENLKEKPLLDDLLDDIVGVIRSCGQKDVDGALKKIEARLGTPFSKVKRPFQADRRNDLTQVLKRFSDIPYPYDTIEFVGTSNFSPQHLTVYFIGHLRGGIRMYAFRVHVYGGKLRIYAMSNFSAYEDIENELARIQDKRSKRFPVVPAQVAKKPVKHPTK